jgi:hypothetical protein
LNERVDVTHGAIDHDTSNPLAPRRSAEQLADHGGIAPAPSRDHDYVPRPGDRDRMMNRTIVRRLAPGGDGASD